VLKHDDAMVEEASGICTNLNSSRCQETVCEAPFLLSISPTPSCSLFIDGWVPIGIEQNQAVASNQVQTTTIIKDIALANQP